MNTLIQICCSLINYHLHQIAPTFHNHCPVPAWDKGSIRYFGIFHYQALGSNLWFQNPEKLLEGGDIYMVCPHVVADYHTTG